MVEKELIIIGAGPAGLRAAQEAQKAGIQYLTLEKGRIGQAWRNTWPDMQMLSPCHPQRDWSSLNTEFPIWKMDVNRPYCSAREFALYLQAFADFYNLDIKEQSAVSDVHPDNKHFIVTDAQQNIFKTPFLLVANGIFGNPYIPPIPGAKYNPIVIHSHQYQGKEAFRKKRVLVVGAGNSAAEIAVELSGYSLIYLTSRKELEYFSETNKLYHIRGVYESYLKELIRMEMIRYMPGIEIKRIDRKRVYWDRGELEVDKIIFATGYRPDFRFLQALKSAKNSHARDKDLRDASYAGLYFAGAAISRDNSLITIHSFIKHIPDLIQNIAQKLRPEQAQNRHT